MSHSRKWFLSFPFLISSAANYGILCWFFHFETRNASSHLAFPQGQKMMVFPSFLNICSSHCPQVEWWDFS
jgi:hypothetical protein